MHTLSRIARDLAEAFRGLFGALTGLPAPGRSVVSDPVAATMRVRCSSKLRRGSDSFTG